MADLSDLEAAVIDLKGDLYLLDLGVDGVFGKAGKLNDKGFEQYEFAAHQTEAVRHAKSRMWTSVETVDDMLTEWVKATRSAPAERASRDTLAVCDELDGIRHLVEAAHMATQGFDIVSRRAFGELLVTIEDRLKEVSSSLQAGGSE